MAFKVDDPLSSCWYGYYNNETKQIDDFAPISLTLLL